MADHAVTVVTHCKLVARVTGDVSLPGSTGMPLAHVICEHKEPEPLPAATDEENFVAMAKLSGKTFEIDSEKSTHLFAPSLDQAW